MVCLEFVYFIILVLFCLGFEVFYFGLIFFFEAKPNLIAKA